MLFYKRLCCWDFTPLLTYSAHSRTGACLYSLRLKCKALNLAQFRGFHQTYLQKHQKYLWRPSARLVSKSEPRFREAAYDRQPSTHHGRMHPSLLVFCGVWTITYWFLTSAVFVDVCCCNRGAQRVNVPVACQTNTTFHSVSHPYLKGTFDASYCASCGCCYDGGAYINPQATNLMSDVI